MPHPDDDKVTKIPERSEGVTLSQEELEAAYARYWDEYMTEFRKLAEQHKDDLNAVKEPTAAERAECGGQIS